MIPIQGTIAASIFEWFQDGQTEQKKRTPEEEEAEEIGAVGDYE